MSKYVTFGKTRHLRVFGFFCVFLFLVNPPPSIPDPDTKQQHEEIFLPILHVPAQESLLVPMNALTKMMESKTLDSFAM